MMKTESNYHSHLVNHHLVRCENQQCNAYQDREERVRKRDGLDFIITIFLAIGLIFFFYFLGIFLSFIIYF